MALELSASDGVTEAVDCAVAVPLKRRAAASARLGLVNDVMLFSRTHTPHPQWSFASTTTAASWYARLARTLMPALAASGICHRFLKGVRINSSMTCTLSGITVGVSRHLGSSASRPTLSAKLMP